MAVCIKCRKDIPESAAFCPWCGANQQPKKTAKRRSSKGGSVYKLPNGTWMAAKVLGYETVDETGKIKRIKATKSGFKTKREALAYLPQLTRKPQKIDLSTSFKDLYEMWLPTHEQKGKSRSTLNCYKAAVKYYEPIWYLPFAELSVDDLQECIDDCPQGKRTRENMKALGTLLYKYAIPRGYVSVNLAQYLYVGGAAGAPREEFTAEEIEIVRRAVGSIPYADYIYCQIYLGFRPHEFLTLDISGYNRQEHSFQGGSKTEAGTNRIVTISPKIQPIIDRLTANRESGPIFCDSNGRIISDKKYREECFYPALKLLGLPLAASDGHERKLTPHCCRHSFATLMKTVDAPDKDKLELMGHTSVKMLQHYQHTDYEDLRRITDQI